MFPAFLCPPTPLPFLPPPPVCSSVKKLSANNSVQQCGGRGAVVLHTVQFYPIRSSSTVQRDLKILHVVTGGPCDAVFTARISKAVSFDYCLCWHLHQVGYTVLHSVHGGQWPHAHNIDHCLHWLLLLLTTYCLLYAAFCLLIAIFFYLLDMWITYCPCCLSTARISNLLLILPANCTCCLSTARTGYLLATSSRDGNCTLSFLCLTLNPFICQRKIQIMLKK